MRKIREVLRLYFAAALSVRAIAGSLGTSPSTVGDYLLRAKVAVDDTGLERRLFPVPPPSRTVRPLPDGSEVHRELRRKGVTLSLLWQEVQGDPPGGAAVQPVLRAVPGLDREARPGDAPGAPRRRGSCSSTTPGRRCRWSTARPARCGRRRIAHSGEIDHPFRTETDHPFRRKSIVPLIVRRLDGPS